MRLTKTLSQLTLLILICSFSAFGQSKALLSKESKVLQISLDSLTIEQILEEEGSLAFKDPKDQLMQMRSEKFGYWIKFDLDLSKYENPHLLIPHYGTDLIEFYQVNDGKVVKTSRSGVHVKMSQQEVESTRSIFELNLDEAEVSTGYFYVEGHNMPSLPFYIVSSQSLIESLYQEDFFGGLVVGLMLLIFIYNISLYFQIREKDNLYYSIWVLCWMFTFFIYKGYVVQFVWPETTFWNDYVDVMFLPTNIAFILFTFKFLKLKEVSKRMYQFGFVIIGMYVILSGFTVAGTADAFYAKFNFGNIIMTQGLWATIAGIMCYRKGFKPAWIYTVANIFLFVTIGIFFAHVFGQIEHSFLAHNSMHIGGGLQIVIFSLALSYKVNLFKKGQEEAEKHKMSLLVENQELVNRQKEDLEIEVKERTKELSEAKLRAEQSEAFKQQFLANMSHEIRTPMNAVMGMTDLVLNTALEPKQRDYLTKVKKSSDNLLHIINDVLDLSKIEAGKMELEEIDFSISDIVEQVKNTLQHKAEEKGLELITKVDSSLSDVVIGDPVRLNQVLINLAGNAIKFTEKGSVAIDLKKEGDRIRFSIIDTGIGIPKDKIKTVFENFGQANTSDTRKYGGTGLGLSISQQLVNLMGGSIDIESEVGKGTTFYFDIDLKEGNKERYEERMAGEENVDGSILNDLTILVADDNEYNRIVARDTLLSKAKVKIIEAENGQEVLDKLTDNIDIILMDAQMPVMSGFEATKKIREQGNNVPIIALTASVLRTDLDRCKDAGMNGYIPKPFKAHELIVGIADALNITLKLDKTASNGHIISTSNGISDNVTNLDYLRDFCAGDESKMQKYIDIFLNSAPKFITDLESLIENKDAEGIANHVHGFNTKLTMMGMKESKSRSINIENELRDSGTTEQVSDKVKALIKDVKIGIDELS